MNDFVLQMPHIYTVCNCVTLGYPCAQMRAEGQRHARSMGAARRRAVAGPLAAGALDSSWRKEDLSITYLHALAASVGVTCDHSERDINGWDVLLAARDTEEADALQLNVQLKCTAGRLRGIEGGHALSFPLKASDYEHLRRSPAHPPRRLVIVRVPEHASPGWITASPQQLIVHASAWYADLTGEPPLPEGQGTKQVRIPSEQRLTPLTLLEQMSSCL